jgi:hypothetical protein
MESLELEKGQILVQIKNLSTVFLNLLLFESLKTIVIIV